jgi:hypothetical protein
METNLKRSCSHCRGFKESLTLTLTPNLTPTQTPTPTPIPILTPPPTLTLTLTYTHSPPNLHPNQEGLTRCSRCKAAYYCGSDCQMAHWKAGHAQDCCDSGPDCSHLLAMATGTSN